MTLPRWPSSCIIALSVLGLSSCAVFRPAPDAADLMATFEFPSADSANWRLIEGFGDPRIYVSKFEGRANPAYKYLWVRQEYGSLQKYPFPPTDYQSEVRLERIDCAGDGINSAITILFSSNPLRSEVRRWQSPEIIYIAENTPINGIWLTGSQPRFKFMMDAVCAHS